MTQRETGPGGDQSPRRDVSLARQGAYYLGGGMIFVGVMLFVALFLSGDADSGPHTERKAREDNARMLAFLGMGLVVAGGFVRSLGRDGAAGSGLVLDPQQARRDQEPLSRQQGGMLKDALDEAGVDLGKAIGAAGGADRKPVVMIRCRACSKLNEEDSKFCQECGAAI